MDKAMFPYATRQVSRRAAIASIFGLAVLPVLDGPGHTWPYDRPPVFRTARHQFTLIEPAAQLPAVALMDLNGRPARLAAVPGSVLLINIWATWCEACRLDLPLLERFHEAAGDRVKVVAVSTDATDREKIRSYLKKLSIRSLSIYLDPDGRLASSSTQNTAPLRLSGMPVTYLITPAGRIAGYIEGVADWLADDAQKLLAYYASA